MRGRRDSGGEGPRRLRIDLEDNFKDLKSLFFKAKGWDLPTVYRQRVSEVGRAFARRMGRAASEDIKSGLPRETERSLCYGLGLPLCFRQKPGLEGST
jgi:hypothetical protein